MSYVFVCIGNFFFIRYDKDDNIGFFYGNFCLVFNLFYERSIDVIDFFCINYVKRMIELFICCIDMVTCYFFDIFYNGDLFISDLIK